MKTTFISKEGNDAKFTITFSAQEFEDAIVKAYKANKDRFVIDGFRRGKAPRKIIENFYGADVFYDEALNDLLQANYPAALEEMDLEVIDQPRLDLEEIKKGEDVVVNFIVACFPEVEVKDYLGLEVEKIEHEVTDEDIQAELERVQKTQSRMETVEDRAAEEGDTVIIDFEGSVDGVAFDGGSAENFELKLGSGQFIPGFEDQLIGQETGADVDVKVTFPEDYHAEELAGKEAVFKCKIHEIKTETLPEIDDELASDVSEFETLEEYKEDLRKKLQERDDQSAESIMKNSMIQRLVELNDIDVPAVMIDDEAQNMLNEMAQQLMYQGLSLDQYKQYLGMDDKMLLDQARPDAENRVRTRLLMRAVAAKEAIEATAEEVEQELERYAKDYAQTVDEMRKMLGSNLRYLKEDIVTRKAIDKMFEAAKFVAPKVEEPAEEAAEEKAEETAADAE
ncbi:MAG: trigger factor [Mogibacterium sp.]|nr:trigger factor [Mogibacterium sp.]